MLKCVRKIRKITVLDSDHSVDSMGKKLFECITPIALMIPHIVVALGMSDDLARAWDIVRPDDFPKQKTKEYFYEVSFQSCSVVYNFFLYLYCSGECGVYAIASAALTIASGGNAYALNDEKVAVFRRYLTSCIWDNNVWSLF